MSETKGWFLGRANGGQDLLAASELADLGFETFIARRYWREVIGGQRVLRYGHRLRPYVFVALTVDKAWPGVTQRTRDEAGIAANVRGMAHLFCNSAELPQRLPGSAVDALKRLEIEEMRDAERKRNKRESVFKEGSEVTVLRGMFAGQTGTLIACVRGIAYVATDVATLTIADCDIGPVEGSAGRMTA